MKLKAHSILKQSMHLIALDMWRYVAVFVVAEAMALLLMRQISSRVFQLALISAKVKGINNQNFLLVLTSPLAILLILLTLVLLASFVIFQMSLVMGFADRPYHGKSLSFKAVFRPIITRIKPSHLLLLLVYIFIIMPLGNLGLTSAITSSLRVPNFILDVIYTTPWMLASYGLLLIVLFYLNIRFFFSFIIFYNESCSFYEAMRRSWSMTQSHAFLVFKLTSFITLYTFVALSLVLAITMLPLFIIEFYAPSYLRIANSLCSTAFLFLTMILVSVSSIALIQTIVVAYHHLNGTDALVEHTVYRPKRKARIINASVLCLYVIFSTLIYFDSPNPDLLGDVFIVSHRGESVKAIENTLDSLRIASTYKPSYVEMDVQQLSDGTLVVFHDSDLKRLAGINRKLNSYTLEDLNRDVILKHNGIESTIPTLDEYLELASALNQDLMIEIKTSNRDDDTFLTQLNTLVSKHEMSDHVIYQSLDKNAILTYKSSYPDAIVGYILGINIGGLEALDVDFFSLEDFSLTPRVVRDAQRMRKGLFVWTVNDESLMQTYFKTDVSGIITDNVELANSVRDEIKMNPFSDIFWNFSFD